MDASFRVLDRTDITTVNSKKILTIYDFAYGTYLATSNFFKQISNIQSALATGQKVTLQTGQVADPQTMGGLLAINIAIETLDSTKTSMEGLSKLGLKNENDLWKLQ